MLQRTYNIEWVIVAIAILWVVTSLVLAWSIEDYSWFSRSGSIAVLLAVIIEYRIYIHIYDDIYRANVQQKNSNFPVKPKPSKNRVPLSYATHILLILGTIIWGYGDLI